MPYEIISLLNKEDDLKAITNTGFRDNEEDIEINNINIPIDSDKCTCIVCQKQVPNAHSCSNCKSTVHVMCGKTRTNATKCIEKQAERMIDRSIEILQETAMGVMFSYQFHMLIEER